MNKNGVFATAAFTFIVSFVFVLILSFAYEGTRDQVQTNSRVGEYRAILTALGIPFDRDDAAEILAEFENITVVSDDNGEVRYYAAETAGREVLAVPVAGPGVWGTIEIIVGANADATRITGLAVVSHNETPGLGGRIEEPWFVSQFAGQRIPDEGGLAFRPGSDIDMGNKDDADVSAITGASRTSDSLEVILAAALERLRALRRSES